MKFELTEEQLKKVESWKKDKEKYTGAIGGQFQYIFTPTLIGEIVEVKDLTTGEELNLTEYDKF